MERTLSILLLWEGKLAEQLRDHLHKVFPLTWSRQQGPQGWKIKFRDVAEFAPRADETYMSRVTKLMSECDCVVALHADQDRLGSDGAGNLWLEVGIWMGRKGSDRLFIASKRAKRPPPNVALPSNLDGIQHFRFGNNTQLDGELNRWLVQLFHERGEGSPVGTSTSNTPVHRLPSLQSDSDSISVLPGPPDACQSILPTNRHELDASRIERVRATLGDPAARWLERHIEVCASEHGVCECSADALTFIAELLRMGRATRELSDVADQLLQIAEAAHKVASLENQSFLREAVRTLRGKLEALAELGDNLLRRPQKGENAEVSWPRIHSFLRFRVEGFQRTSPDTQELSQGLDLFISRAIEFSGKLIYQSPFFTGTGGLTPGERDRMAHFEEFARKLARHLEQLRVSWFELTNQTMKRHFRVLDSLPPHSIGSSDATLNSLAGTIQRLGALSRELPHNLSSSWQVRVWPNDSKSTGGA